MWGGQTSVELIFDLPKSRDALLHVLRWDEWYLDERGEDFGLDTIDPDEVGEWEDDELSLESQSGACDEECDAESLSDSAEPTPNRDVVELRQLRGDEIEAVEVRGNGVHTALAPTVDAVVDWLRESSAPAHSSEACQTWASPLAIRKDLSVIRETVDPTVVPNAAWRAQIAATGLPWLIRHYPSSLELVLVPPALGYFGPCETPSPSMGPRHGRMLLIEAPLYIAVTPFTMRNWYATFGKALPENLPPMGVVSNLTGDAIDVVLKQLGMSLPTELEWEFACRAGTLSDCYSHRSGVAWSADRMRKKPPTRGPVVAAMLPANGFGLHDMLGLAWEPCKASSGARILCGGSLSDPEERCSALSRAPLPAAGTQTMVAMRPVIHVTRR